MTSDLGRSDSETQHYFVGIFNSRPGIMLDARSFSQILKSWTVAVQYRSAGLVLGRSADGGNQLLSARIVIPHRHLYGLPSHDLGQRRWLHRGETFRQQRWPSGFPLQPNRMAGKWRRPCHARQNWRVGLLSGACRLTAETPHSQFF